MSDTDWLELGKERPAHSDAQHPLAGAILQLRKRHKSDGASISVGRSSENDVVVDDRSVSQHHASFQRRGETFFVTDTGSRNGTSVNLCRLASAKVWRLEDGDVITFGRVSFQFYAPAPLYLALKAFMDGAA